MNKLAITLVFLVAALLVAGCRPVTRPPAASSSANPDAERTPPLAARALVAPGALAGPLPAGLAWNPHGAQLAYVAGQAGTGQAGARQAPGQAVFLYDADSGGTRVLLNAAAAPAGIDLASLQWSPAGDALLFGGGGSLWVLRLADGALQPLALGEEAKTAWMFLPDGQAVSYVQGNDLYVAPLAGGEPRRLTHDGSDAVFNGGLDWVYTEELSTRSAQPGYAWSPGGASLLYLRLDDSAVNNDPVTDFRPVPAAVSYTRYPAVGAANPLASLHLLPLDASGQPDAGRAQEVELPEGAEYVLPYFTWAPDGGEVFYTTVNRDHTVLELSAWNPVTAQRRTVIRETDPFWINEERYAAPVFLGEGDRFLWLSERDGFMHLYLYARSGELIRLLTAGEWMIDTSGYYMLVPGRPVAVDPAGEWAYFSSTRGGPLERQIERVNIATGALEQITAAPGFHLTTLSGDGRYLVDHFSDVATPPAIRIVGMEGGGEQVLAQAAAPSLPLPALTREFVTVSAHDGTPLYAQLVKPADFDPARKYPVVVHWYGGPGLQMVSNRYGTTNIFNLIERDVLYTQLGLLVWRLDNRGSFGRGHAFETPIFGELGAAALDDQLAGVEYLRTLPYVDAARIGADGKSFGGYMTLYALLHAPEVFRCGVAGAAPTDWRLYDTIYTERYMRTPAANPDGYAATDLIGRAGEIEARPLLIHGLADTNVHLQNTVNFIQALEAADKPFAFTPLPNLGHSFHGDGLAAALAASAEYLGECLGER